MKNFLINEDRTRYKKDIMLRGGDENSFSDETDSDVIHVEPVIKEREVTDLTDSIESDLALHPSPKKPPSTRKTSPRKSPSTRRSTPKKPPSTRKSSPKKSSSTRKSSPKKPPSTRKSSPKKPPSTRKSSPRKSSSSSPSFLHSGMNQETLTERKTNGGPILEGDELYDLGFQGYYPPSLLTMTQSDLVTALQIEFHKKKVRIENMIQRDKTVIRKVSGYDLTNRRNSHNRCFTIEIHDDASDKNIEIIYLKCCDPPQVNCTLKGPLILEMLTQLAEVFQYRISIGSDESEVELSNPSKTEIDLPTFNIFLYGESFYNRQHFYSKNHTQDKLFNSKIRNKSLGDVLEKSELDELRHSVKDLNVDERTLVKELAMKMLSVIKSRTYSDDFANALEIMVDALKDKFRYHNKNLLYQK